MSPRTLSLLVAIALLVVTSAANASTIHVPGDQPTIQAGINAASAGDTVLVAAGWYSGAGNRDLDFGGANITLRGAQGAGNTFIDSQGLGRGFYFHSGEDTTAVVQGFTIQHAAADSGAGAKCINYSSPRFLDCTFRLNEATTRGGGVCCYRSAAVFRRCLFEENETAGTTYPYGGAMALILDSDATVADCRFSNNTAAGLGGGVYCQDADAQFSRCVFSGNAAPSLGGAVFGCWCGLAFDDCAFSDGSAIEGGAIHVQNGALTVTDCDFTGNSAVRGGAVFMWYSYASLQMSWCTLEGNSASEGGALYCYGGASCTLSHCTMVSNSSTTGGIIYGNEASPLVDHCIIAFSPQGAAASCQTGTETPVFTRLVLFGNGGGDGLCGSVSDTLHRDPRLCDMTGEDYHLCQNSVCAPANNAWSELIGALDTGCGACDSPVDRTSWGAIKALYR